MSDPALALQKAVVAAIKALATAAGDNVFDTVPESDPFPRVTVGTGQTVGVYADCYDGSECFHQIDVWSRAVGFPECKAIASAIRDLLNEPSNLTVSGHTLETIEVRSVDYSRDPDGLTSRARMTVRTQSQPSD
ncbi:DUF3168 domain-containing protein [Kaustia mangrovi]|uniref:DUF3168 domain-containing protein n=1 Tax=Kaustia mangrovi TaxID=2593653 RepID=A0A7S8C4Y2_9HYPH|nr:DUF3168 domain-containing protein [Kaustia mangrovi]QPC43490.1 DUF3168 domain-containing protein [Kaustia mangrovi]